MNAAGEAKACPRCGAGHASIKGLCPACVARGAADWLAAPMVQSDGGELSIPGWRITGTLGAGGMGRVFQAESEHDGVLAAIKVLDAKWSRDPVMAARFEGEAAMLRRLEHPNIVRLLDTTETEDGRLCIVMELVGGCDLGRLLRAEKLQPARAAELFRKICAAVEHAHAEGFIHRDIKPSNILVGADGTVKLADFGLAKELDGEGATAIGGLTATTDQFGTAYYLAPERMIPGAECGPQADVYALGVLLYHLLTGRMPLGKYSPPSEFTGLPAMLDRIVSNALEANPSRRTASVKELRIAFEKVWSEHLAGASRARKWKRVAFAAASLIAAIAAVAAGAWWQRERMSPKPVVFADPASASLERPWANSLGMKFVPVPGTKVLFSIYELRRMDAQPFVDVNRNTFGEPWQAFESERRQAAIKRSIPSLTLPDGSPVGNSWEDMGWPTTPEHPATLLSLGDAERYCLWLTWREQAEGRLKPNQHYRLPTNEEWLTAAGGPDAPPRPGNVAGPEARVDGWPESLPTLEKADPFPRTAPVGSFPVELYGLYDISGNVSEWTLDPGDSTDDATRKTAHLRGACFGDGSVEKTAASYLRPIRIRARFRTAGVRLVLDYAPKAE